MPYEAPLGRVRRYCVAGATESGGKVTCAGKRMKSELEIMSTRCFKMLASKYSLRLGTQLWEKEKLKLKKN